MAALVALTLALALTAAVTATAKECTNIPTELSSHTVRARLQAAPGGAAEWRWRELFHEHLNPTDEAAWMDLMPPPGAAAAAQHQQHHRQEELDWVMLYRSLKGQQQQQPVGGGTAAAGSTPFLEEVSLHDVRLDPDGDVAYGRAQQTNLEYLLLLDVDRLVWSFRSQAGLPAPGTPYGGWEKPDSELRGHFVGTCSVSLSCPPNHAHAEMLRRHARSLVRTRTRPLLHYLVVLRTPAEQIDHPWAWIFPQSGCCRPCPNSTAVRHGSGKAGDYCRVCHSVSSRVPRCWQVSKMPS
jgi:hypothetical protein